MTKRDPEDPIIKGSDYPIIVTESEREGRLAIAAGTLQGGSDCDWTLTLDVDKVSDELLEFPWPLHKTLRKIRRHKGDA